MSLQKVNTTSLRNIRDLSKDDTIEFIRKHINPNLRCIEDLGTGVDLCKAMSLLFPKCCDVHKIKTGPKLSDSEKRSNFNLLRTAFKTSGINKNFPSEIMMKQNFQSNFYFAQWFVRFFEAHQKSREKKKEDNNNTNNSKNLPKIRKNIQGGARSATPRDSITSKSPRSDRSSSTVQTPSTALIKAGTATSKRKPLTKSFSYAKARDFPMPEISLKEGSSQTDLACAIVDEEKVENLMDAQKHLQRISMEQIEFIEQLQKENERLAESLEHCNLQKSYFHKKLDQIEELCEDSSSEGLRTSLKRILYEEGLPM